MGCASAHVRVAKQTDASWPPRHATPLTMTVGRVPCGRPAAWEDERLHGAARHGRGDDGRGRVPRPRQGVRVPSRSISPPWGSIRFRRALHTYAPLGVRVVPDRRTKSRKIHTRNILPLFLVIRYATDEALFKCQFSVALLKTTELGVRPRSLMAVGGAGAGHVQAACAGPESHASTADTTSTTAAGLASTAAPTPDATAVDPCTENCKLPQNRGTRHWRRPMVIRAPP